VIGIFIVCALTAVGLPTTLLSRTPDAAKLVMWDPDTEGMTSRQVIGKNGPIRAESVAPYGCIRIRVAEGKEIGPICNRHMSCLDGASLPAQPSHVYLFRLSNTEQYFAETGSANNSSCWDYRGTKFAGDGKRLDDGPLQRIYLRLGLLGLSVLGMGAAGAVLRLLGSRWLGWRVATLIGFASAIVCLWT
jgi:hypothetical protein